MSREDLRAAPLVMDTRFDDKRIRLTGHEQIGRPTAMFTVPTPIPQPAHDPHNFRQVVTIGLAATTALLAIATVILVGIIRGWW